MKRPYTIAFGLLLFVYILLTFTLPTNPEVLERYDLTQVGIRLLNLTIVLPLVLIYLSALYGFHRINSYALSIKDTKEGPHYYTLAKGLMVLAFGLPIQSIISSVFTYVSYKDKTLLPAATILRGYITLAFSMAAILLISRGAFGLLNTLKNKSRPINTTYALLGPIAIASLYTWLITTQGTFTSNSGQGYFMPSWLVIATIAMPYTFIWCVGIRAAYHLNQYKIAVKGILYKGAFKNLSIGIGVIILVSVFIQFINSMSAQLTRLKLTPLLGIVYFLILLYTVGYGLVALGAKKLKQIEEA